MNYRLNCPSLEHIALVKIATTLWNEDDIRDLISKFSIHLLDFEKRRKWQGIENKVIEEKVPQLSLPQSLKEEIMCFIKPVGLQVLKWIKYDNENCLYIGLPNELCWTPHGTVDKKKTAKALIKGESLDVSRRYKLACLNCLEDDVQELCNKIPENLGKSFYSDEDPIKVRQQDLVVHWTDDIKRKAGRRRWRYDGRGCSPYQYTFEYAATESDNKAATEYFFQKLTPGEKEESLVKTAKEVVRRFTFNTTYMAKVHYKADVMCFLLSQMDGEQQTEVFKTYPHEVLKCLLEWPWQSLFMETANRLWDILGEHHFGLLLSEIVEKIKEGHKDYDYENLFREFWQQSPNDHKRYIIEKELEFLLIRLLQIEDKENIKLILRDATLIDKRIFDYIGQEIRQILICDNEWVY